MNIRSKQIIPIIIAIIILLSHAANANSYFEPMDLGVGGRPVYGLVFGEFASHYYNAPGGFVYARGLYRLNIADKLMLYPEVRCGVMYLGNRTEHGRKLMLFPIEANIFFDAPVLNFNTKAGLFALRPYIGLGLYLNHFESPRAKVTNCDFGYQAGISLVYRHVKMKNAYVEASVDHLFTTNFKHHLPLLAFSIGAGYSFESPLAKKTLPDDRDEMRSKHTDDLNSDGVNQSTPAAGSTIRTGAKIGP